MFTLTYLCYVMHSYTEHAIYIGGWWEQGRLQDVAVVPDPPHSRPWYGKSDGKKTLKLEAFWPSDVQKIALPVLAYCGQ